MIILIPYNRPIILCSYELNPSTNGFLCTATQAQKTSHQGIDFAVSCLLLLLTPVASCSILYFFFYWMKELAVDTSTGTLFFVKGNISRSKDSIKVSMKARVSLFSFDNVVTNSDIEHNIYSGAYKKLE